jgi:hypothetical protein
MTVKRLGLLAILLGGSLLTIVIPAHTQDTDSLEAAKRAYLEGRFEDSVRDLQPLLETLTEATDLRDAHFFLGLNYMALGREDEARSQFGSAVKQDPDFVPPASLYSPDIVTAYEEVRRELVGRIRVVSEPAGAQVSLAGKPLGRAPIESAVPAGEYMIGAELEGHAPVQRPVQVRAGEETEITLSLPSVAEPEPDETPEEPEVEETPAQVSSGGGGMSGKTIGIIAGVGGGAAVAALAAGGGGDSGTSPTSPTTPTPTPPTASRANISASIAPNPMSAQASGDAEFPWLVEFTVNVRETAGLGGNVDFINVTLRNPATGGETRALNYGANEVAERAGGTNHINARGSLTVPISIRYRLAGGARRAVVITEIRFTDDRGNVMNATAEANIQ